MDDISAQVLNISQKFTIIDLEQYLLEERAIVIQRLGLIEDQLIKLGRLQRRSIEAQRKRQKSHQ
jgi:hypothetical protein